MSQAGRVRVLIAVLLPVFLAGPTITTPARAQTACGVKRWSVKTGTDPDAGQVSLTNWMQTTVASLDALSQPSSLPSNNRVAPVETTQYEVTATMTEFKREDDQDFHIVLQDTAGNTMIVEIPDPACVGSSSPFAPAIAAARSAFTARFTPTTSFQMVNQPVDLRGVGFWDENHGQTGVAPNAIELHPVLTIAFSAGFGGVGTSGGAATPTPTPTATAALLAATPSPAAALAAATPAPTPVPISSSLPRTGADTQILGLSAATLVEIGVALLLLAGWIARRWYRQRHPA